MKIGIGIDTGGTYTDAVIYDFESKKILGTSKALSTKDDLSVGILNALDALPPDSVKKAQIISLSTTLATNACVEDKGGSARLIFLGGDRTVIDSRGQKYGLPSSEEIYIQESFTKFSGEIEREPDWDQFSAGIRRDFKGLDGAGIIEMNGVCNGGVIERKAQELFKQQYDIPVICAHELFGELNSLQRGASTLLNARLVPVIHEFIKAIEAAIAQRGIQAKIVIVRSDGSLMSGELAFVRPVETLLCGPAASVLGSAFSAKEENCIVVDMGGTTTDIAFINQGNPVKVVNGISIGKWKTFVGGLYIKTFGLGGDTAIHYGDKGMFLEDYRVVPLCVAAATYPCIIDNLKKILATTPKHMKYLHEHCLLVKDIEDNPRYSSEEKKLCAALKKGPLTLTEAATILERDVYSLNLTRLVNDGVVQMCGLTPTDIMHIKGDFSQFSVEASLLGAQFVAANVSLSVDELCERVYDEVKRRLYVYIVKAMLENKKAHYLNDGVGEDVERLINESYDEAKTGKKDDLVSMLFQTNYVLVGVGAPIPIFLDEVATMLGTKAVLPQHYAVANALGAIVSNVSATCTVEVRPKTDSSGIIGYTSFGFIETQTFPELENAEEFALAQAKEGALIEAKRRGAQGEIVVTASLKKHDITIGDGLVCLGVEAIAHATGSIGL